MTKNIYEVYYIIRNGIDGDRLGAEIMYPVGKVMPNGKGIVAIPIHCMDGAIEYLTIDTVKGNKYIRVLDRKMRRVLSRRTHSSNIDIIANDVYEIIWEEI